MGCTGPNRLRIGAARKPFVCYPQYRGRRGFGTFTILRALMLASVATISTDPTTHNRTSHLSFHPKLLHFSHHHRLHHHLISPHRHGRCHHSCVDSDRLRCCSRSHLLLLLLHLLYRQDGARPRQQAPGCCGHGPAHRHQEGRLESAGTVT